MLDHERVYRGIVSCWTLAPPCLFLTFLFLIFCPCEDACALTWEEEGFYGSSGAGGRCQVLVVDERVYLFWVEAGFNNDTLWFQWYDGETWTVPTYIANTQPRSYEMGYDVDGGDGTVHLVWQTKINEDRDLYYMAFDGASWSTQVLLTAEKRVSNQTNPSIVTLGNQVHIAYRDDSRADPGIYHRHFDGTTWKPAEKRSTEGSDDDGAVNPQLAVWGKQVLLAWRGEGGIRLVTYDGGAWGTVLTVVSDVYSSMYKATSLTACKDGAFIAYQTRVGSDFVINLTSNHGPGWSQPETVNKSRVHYSSIPCIAADMGYILLVHTDMDERVTFMYHNGTGWSPSEVLNSTKEMGQWYPHLTFTDGKVRVVFHHLIGGYNLIKYLEGDLEATPPSSWVSMSGPYWTSASSIGLEWTFTDDFGISDLTLEYRHSTDNATWSDWTEFMFEDGESGTHANGTTTFEPTNGDGHYQFRSIATDVWGKVEPPPAEPETSLGLDTTAPGGFIWIEDGYGYTTTPNVTLRLDFGDVHSGVAKVRFGDEDIGGDEPWEDPAWVREWELAPGSGVRTVAYQVMDALGHLSEVCSDSIVLDQDKPYCEIGIPGGLQRIRNRTLVLVVSYGDDTSPVWGLRLSNTAVWDGWEWMDPSEEVVWNLSEGDGEKTVYYQVVDAAQQRSMTYTLTLTLDTTAPYVASTNPEEGDKDVDRNSSLTVTFSEPMNTTSVEEAIGIQYFDHDYHTWMDGKDFEWSPDGKMVTFRPNRTYGQFTGHMLRIYDQMAMDLAGNPLHTQVDVNYTVTPLDIPGPGDDGNGDGGDGEGDDGSLWGVVVALIIIVVVLVAMVGYLMFRGRREET